MSYIFHKIYLFISLIKSEPSLLYEALFFMAKIGHQQNDYYSPAICIILYNIKANQWLIWRLLVRMSLLLIELVFFSNVLDRDIINTHNSLFYHLNGNPQNSETHMGCMYRSPGNKWSNYWKKKSREYIHWMVYWNKRWSF